jgi:hypothetical protein
MGRSTIERKSDLSQNQFIHKRQKDRLGPRKFASVEGEKYVIEMLWHSFGE